MPPPAAPGAAVWDLDRQGVPRIASHDYIELDKIERISLFRSSVGHDYSDGWETCLSMKHYYLPRTLAQGLAVEIRAPLRGEVVRIRDEWAGAQVEIRSDSIPAIMVTLFHVTLDGFLHEGARVEAGARLGTHVGPQTFSDVAVRVETPTGSRLVSYVELLGDAVWADYAERGLAARSDLVLSRAERDADPLRCDGETFVTFGALPQWATLR